MPDYSTVMAIGPINTTGFLFGDDDDKTSTQQESTTSPEVKNYLQMNTTDDKFPVLIRNNHHPGLVGFPPIKAHVETDGFLQLSASSAALDLALSQSPGPESQSNGWPAFARHRPSQQSLPQNVFEAQQPTQQSVESPTSVSHPSYEAAIESPTTNRQLNRRSLEATMASYAQKNMLNQGLINGSTPTRPSLGNFQSSYSTNDIPTMKNINGVSTPISAPKPTPQQQFHNHNASLGRIPPHAVNQAVTQTVNNRMSREIPSNETRREENTNGFKQPQSELHASAAPFGPSMSATTMSESMMGMGAMSSPSMPQYPGAAYYGGYGLQLMNVGMSHMQMGGPLGYNSQMSLYQAQNQYSPYSQYGQSAARFPDSQARIIQQRRMQNVEGRFFRPLTRFPHTQTRSDVARFTNTKIENYQGDIYALCKDQHGCRYLQKQLETRNPETIHLVFVETNQHVVELMTGSIPYRFPYRNQLISMLQTPLATTFVKNCWSSRTMNSVRSSSPTLRRRWSRSLLTSMGPGPCRR